MDDTAATVQNGRLQKFGDASWLGHRAEYGDIITIADPSVRVVTGT